MRLASSVLCVALLGAGVGASGGHLDATHLFAAIGITDAEQRESVAAGTAVVIVVPSQGRDLAVAGVARTTAGGRRLAAWSRAVEHIHPRQYTRAIGRFSNPPQLSDLAALTLDDRDVDDLRRCRPGDCAVKLAGGEMAAITAEAEAAGDRWKPAVQLAFKRAIVERARRYLQTGLAGTPAYEDHETAVSPSDEFAAIAHSFVVEPLATAGVLGYFESYPGGSAADVESFLYWSKETLGAGKPIVSVTHVAIFRCPTPAGPGTIVAARQVFASHYMHASLSMTVALDTPGVPGYLLYMRRVRSDAFEGFFGGLVRRIAERRIRSDAPGVLDALRRRLEGGEPPVAHSR